MHGSKINVSLIGDGMRRTDILKKSLHDCCPTCGGPLVNATFHVDLETNTLVNGNAAVKVPPRYAELIWLLHKHYPRTVVRSTIIDKIWADNFDIESKTLDTTVCLARRFIEQIGYGIKCEWNVGYRLVKL